MPRSRECRLQRAGTLLQDVSRNLFRVGARMRKSDGELERARPHAELGADGDVARARAVVGLGDVSIRVVQLDMDVGAAVVASGRAAERTDDAHPHVLLTHEQRRRMRVEHLAEVALGAGRPVRRSLHEETDVRQLGSEGARDDHRVLVGVGNELLREAVLVVRALNGEGRHAWAQPGDAVLAVTRVVDRRRARR